MTLARLLDICSCSVLTSGALQPGLGPRLTFSKAPHAGSGRAVSVHPELYRPPEPICTILADSCQPKTSDPTGEVLPDCHVELEVNLISTINVPMNHYMNLRCQPQWSWWIRDADDGI